MKHVLVLGALGIGMIAAPARAAERDMLSQMFDWWNGAMKTDAGVTPDGMKAYFTPDAVLIIDGSERARGLSAWSQHFQGVKKSGREVEIVLPFRHVSQQGNLIYNYHLMRTRINGDVTCVLLAGHAMLEGGKLREVNLVRYFMPPEQIAKEPQCWQKTSS